jgi:hypothetical protein
VSGLREALGDLEMAWASLGIAIDITLKPGLSEDHVRAVLTDAFGYAHPDLVQWFSWHDGQSQASGPIIAPLGGFLLPLHLCLVERQKNLDIGPDPYEFGDMTFSPTWLPLTDHPPLVSFDTQSGAIRAISWNDNESFIETAAPDLTTAVRLWIIALKGGYYRWYANKWHYDYAEIPLEIRSSGLVG